MYAICFKSIFYLWELIRKPDISEREMKCGGYLKNGEINLRGIWYNEHFELFQMMINQIIFKDTNFPHEYISIEYYPRRTQVERFISWFNRRGDSIEYLREYSLNDNYRFFLVKIE